MAAVLSMLPYISLLHLENQPNMDYHSHHGGQLMKFGEKSNVPVSSLYAYWHIQVNAIKIKTQSHALPLLLLLAQNYVLPQSSECHDLTTLETLLFGRVTVTLHIFK